MSETIFLTCEKLETRARRTEGSKGEILPFVALSLSKEPLAEDMIGLGKIEVKTPFLFLGYLRPGGELDPPLTGDGFFSTGDTGLPG